MVLRLDGGSGAAARQRAAAAPAQVDLSKRDGLGNVEAAVMSKYAAQDSDGDEEGSDGDEE